MNIIYATDEHLFMYINDSRSDRQDKESQSESKPSGFSFSLLLPTVKER